MSILSDEYAVVWVKNGVAILQYTGSNLKCYKGWKLQLIQEEAINRNYNIKMNDTNSIM
jgi:hypothetical protein